MTDNAIKQVKIRKNARVVPTGGAQQVVFVNHWPAEQADVVFTATTTPVYRDKERTQPVPDEYYLCVARGFGHPEDYGVGPLTVRVRDTRPVEAAQELEAGNIATDPHDQFLQGLDRLRQLDVSQAFHEIVALAEQYAEQKTVPEKDFSETMGIPMSDTLQNAVHRVYFRAGLLAAREAMARAADMPYATLIRTVWWPELGQDPGVPRQLLWDEIADGDGSNGPINARPIDPSVEALPIAWEFLHHAPSSPETLDIVPLQLEPYSAGLLSDFGGGDVNWWQDYLRAELGRAQDYYQSQLDSLRPGSSRFQRRVDPWMLECFDEEIAADTQERNHRFLEEALETVQAAKCTREEAIMLVNYVFDRPVGELPQEIGGAMVTLAALASANGLDMHDCGEVELARISTPEMIAKIRHKQATKPKGSPLPQHVTPTTQDIEQ